MAGCLLPRRISQLRFRLCPSSSRNQCAAMLVGDGCCSGFTSHAYPEWNPRPAASVSLAFAARRSLPPGGGLRVRNFGTHCQARRARSASAARQQGSRGSSNGDLLPWGDWSGGARCRAGAALPYHGSGCGCASELQGGFGQDLRGTGVGGTRADCGPGAPPAGPERGPRDPFTGPIWQRGQGSSPRNPAVPGKRKFFGSRVGCACAGANRRARWCRGQPRGSTTTVGPGASPVDG